MNLSPDWVEVLEKGGYEAVHWRSVGDASASDTEIMCWARQKGYVVFTNDLDYGALLYATGASAPSVLQIRADDVRPITMAEAVLLAIEQAGDELRVGALVTIDPRKNRITALPLRKK